MSGPSETSNIKWMYDGTNSTVDRESYLLGKRINKAPEDKGDFIVEDTNTRGGITVLERLDYQSKLREDPLVAIQKRESEKRKELLSNPIKRKRLQNTLKNALLKDLQEDSDSDSDDVDKLLKNKDKKFQESLRKALQDDLSSSSDEGARKKKKKSKKKKKRRSSSSESDAANKKLNYREKDHRTKDYRRKHYGDKSDYSRSYKDNKTRSDERHKHKYSRRYSRSPDRTDYKKESKRQKSFSPESPKKERKEGYGLIMLKHKEKIKSKAPEIKSQAPVVEKYKRKEKQGFTRKLTKEQLEQKRREMMENATDRDEQRKSNVEHYTNEDKLIKEREAKVNKIHDEQRKRDGKAKTFIHDLKLKRAAVGSLEDTVRRNRHSLRKNYE